MKFKNTDLYKEIKDKFYYNKDGKLTYDSDIDCIYNNLTSLEGCPEVINGSFDCFNNKLTSLKGCPELVYGNFYCSSNNLTLLDYFPYIDLSNYYISSDFSDEEILDYYNETYPEFMI